ncbi:MAG: DUF5916 domain-containing protein [Gemmatimonadales bacterium]
MNGIGTNVRLPGCWAGLAAVLAAVLALPSPLLGQQALIQQAQDEVPEDWASRAGICRRTTADCEGRSAGATRLEPDESVEVDGRLDEPVWGRVAWVSDFIQVDPIEGARPTVRTEVGFAYDGRSLYVAGRMHDPEPTEIRANLARRDDHGSSDRLVIWIDSYQNRRTSYAFVVTAAGGRVDYVTSSDDRSESDVSYDPVWSARAAITDDGWVAEMRIPFSQLRFNRADDLAFGVNVRRYIPARDEDLFWAPVPKDESGWTSWFGDLEGLRGIRTRRPLELVPYVASDFDVTSGALVDPDDPFSTRTAFAGRAGADLKVGIGSGLTLDATFNPDFGQVEADPAEVNLSAFPTFFDERRPFFVENADLLEANDLFFSRRIGEHPHGSTPGTYSDVPQSTTILGAAKLTGRTASGLSLGALGAVTGEESAEFFDQSANEFGRVRVEPTTGWLVLRGLQEFGTAKNTVGLAFTGVRRDLADGDLLAAALSREAFAASADLNLQFDGGRTQLNTVLQGSRVSGTPEAMARIQQFSAHYFQRPDAKHVEFDPSRTSLTGYQTKIAFDRRDGDHWLLRASLDATSPEFDNNDAGALNRADLVDGNLDVEYTENRVGTFRNWTVGATANGNWNFDGTRTYSEYDLWASFQLRNYWTIEGGPSLWPGALSDTQTRGGPLMATPTEVGGYVYVKSDPRDRLGGNAYAFFKHDSFGGWLLSTGADVSYRPGGAWQFSIEPSYEHEVDTRQYVTTLDGGAPTTFGRRYVFGRIDRHTLSAQLRVDYSLSPDLSVEGYFEPFAATGAYSDFGELAAPRSETLRMYGTDGTSIEESVGPAPRVVGVSDGPDRFSFLRRDFRAVSFRSNLVMRWEWLPGSTLFLVWQLDRGGFDFESAPDTAGVSDLWSSPAEPGRSILAIKATYWLPI